jgi:hypothetical protein
MTKLSGQKTTIKNSGTLSATLTIAKNEIATTRINKMIITKYNKKAIRAYRELARIDKLIIKSKWSMKFAFGLVPITVPGDINTATSTSYATMRTYYTKPIYRVSSVDLDIYEGSIGSIQIAQHSTVNILSKESLSYFAIEDSQGSFAAVSEPSKPVMISKLILSSTTPIIIYDGASHNVRSINCIQEAYRVTYGIVCNTKLVAGLLTPDEFSSTISAYRG